MLIRALLALLGWVGDCPQCSTNDRDVLLCEAHAREEREVLEAQKLRFTRAEDDAGRIAALEAIAHTTSTHENAPSPAVPRALECGLQVQSLTVRARALELLASPQHAEETLEVLLRALRAWRKETEELMEKTLRSTKVDEDPSPEQMLAAAEFARQMALEWQVAAQQQEIEKQLVVLLSRYPDDRVVAELGRPKWTAGPEWLYDEAMQTLVELGSRASVQAMLAGLEQAERTALKGAAHIEDLRKEKLPRPTKDWKGTEAAWTAQQESLRDMRVRIAERDQKTNREHRARLLARLDGLAAKVGKQPVSPDEADLPRAWRAWSRENSAAFPEHLPGVKGPSLERERSSAAGDTK